MFFGFEKEKQDVRGGNEGIAQRFPRTVEREGNLGLVFLAFHRPAFPRCTEFVVGRTSRDFPILAKAEKQLVLGGLHALRRIRVAARIGHALQV